MELTVILLLFLWDCVELTLANNRCSQLPTYERAFVSAGYIKAEYQQGDVIYFSCDPGYTSGLNTTYVCTEYGWRAATFGQCIEVDPTFPIRVACAPPPPLTNGILLQNSIMVFQDGQQARYQCDPLYRMTGGGFKTCSNGQWTGDPQCQAYCRTPDIHNGFVVSKLDTFPHNTVLHYGCNASFTPVEDTVICQNGNWSSSPQCVSSPISSAPDHNSQPLFTTIDKCGTPPVLINGVLYNESTMFLSYECNHFYKRIGNRIVRCVNGQWTPPPTCEVDFCLLETSQYSQLENIGNVFIKSGSDMKLDCSDPWRLRARAKCRNNLLYLSECCSWIRRHFDLCKYDQIMPPQ